MASKNVEEADSSVLPEWMKNTIKEDEDVTNDTKVMSKEEIEDKIRKGIEATEYAKEKN